jgi:hypothetical protein
MLFVPIFVIALKSQFSSAFINPQEVDNKLRLSSLTFEIPLVVVSLGIPKQLKIA